MAKVNLNGVTIEEINRNATNAYAAGIESGEIYSAEGCHSKNGNPMLKITGRNLRLKGFDGSTFIAEGCILYNPPIIKSIIEACDDSDDSIYIIKGVVSKTAPASKPTSDTVLSREELKKEMAAIQAKFFSLTDSEQETAKSRMAAIEAQLKA